MFVWSPYAGIRSPGVAAALTAYLNTSPQPPLTVFLEDLLKVTVTVRVLAAEEHRLLTRKEAARLEAGDRTTGCWRSSLLYAGDALAASATLLWLPGRLPAAECGALDAGMIPAGKILEPLGGHRVDCHAMDATGFITDEATGQPVAVQCTAVLATGDERRVAIAEEFILGSFAETLAFAMASLARHQHRASRRHPAPRGMRVTP
jgi:hypothetical protein